MREREREPSSLLEGERKYMLIDRTQESGSRVIPIMTLPSDLCPGFSMISLQVTFLLGLCPCLTLSQSKLSWFFHSVPGSWLQNPEVPHMVSLTLEKHLEGFVSSSSSVNK